MLWGQENMISVGIVSLNNPEYVDFLIKSLKRNTRSDFEVLIHVNIDTGAFEDLFKKHADVISTTSKTRDNIGYAPALNKLFTQAKGSHFCFIDDDIYVAPDWDIPLLHAFDDSLYQYICPTLFYPGFNNKRFGTTPANFEEDKFNTTWRESRDIIDNSNMVIGNYMVTREMWQHLGGYDETPDFINAADVDLKAKIFFTAVQNACVLRGINCADSCFYHFGNVSERKGYRMCTNFRELFQAKYHMSLEEFSKLLCAI